MRPGPQAISADQTVDPKNRPRRRTNVSALEDRRAETRPFRGQMHPASDTRVRILVFPYLFFLGLRRKAVQAALLGEISHPVKKTAKQ
jgi:hypothetical protein